MQMSHAADRAGAGSWRALATRGQGTTLLWVLAALLTSAFGARACDVPVYRYTLDNWQRDRYLAYYFHDGGAKPADAAVNRYLERVAAGRETGANLTFASVDVSKITSAAYTDQQRQAWSRVKTDRLPVHAILTPKWGKLFVGKLDLQTARSLVDSPKRDEVAKQLCQGKQGLLLLLLGPSDQENAVAQRALREAVAAAKTKQMDLGIVEVSRTDPGEKGFVQQLLGLEDDLAGLKNPMVFAVFGRGHVMEPYVGKGITRDNLLELAAFMNGPCSCDIKSSSAGMDLLTSYDWENRVAALPPPSPATGESTAADRPAHSYLFDVGDQATTASSAGAKASVAASGQVRKSLPAAKPATRPAADPRPFAKAPASGKPGAPVAGTEAQPHTAQVTKPSGDRVVDPATAAPPGPTSTAETAPAVFAPAAEPYRAPYAEEDGGPSLGRRLAVQSGVVLGITALLVLVVGFAIVQKRRRL